MDDAAERYDVQPVNSAGTAYIAVCGLNSGRLDHAKRTIEFSAAALKIILQFNAANNASLTVRIGVDSGAVTSGVIGARRFKFGLWGDTVDTARAARNRANPNTVLITENAFERVNDYFDFQDVKPLAIDSRELRVFELKPDRLQPTLSDAVETV